MSDNNIILNGSELMSIQDEPDNYLIEGFLWENENIILLAREKVGKSIIAVQMACCLTSGESFLDEYEIPEPMEILYIQTESTRHETIQRIRSMTSDEGISWNPEKFHLLCTHSLELDHDKCLDWLIRQIEHKDFNPKVIFIDPLYMSMKGSLVDDEKSRALSRNIRKLGEGFQSSVVVVHHEHRPRRHKTGEVMEEGDDSIMGSFVWKAFPNHIIRLRCRPDKIRTICCDTQRSGRVISEMQLKLIQPLPLHFEILNTADYPPFIDTVLGWLKYHSPQCANDIHKATGLALSSVKKGLSYLSRHNVNKIKKINPGKRPTFYELNNSTN